MSMNAEFSKLFLSKMRSLIVQGKRHFLPRTYPDGTRYIEHLARLGIESIDEAWDYIMQLNESNYVDGPLIDVTSKPPSEDPVVWEFKSKVNTKVAYIKLKDDFRRGCVCISFHEDEPHRAK
ncbi:hypothetical protein [Desulfosporosinus meridiei]|uniref:Type II toxin-antitoxin system MqsR family toxin n=1 Tax=Desulfosporosinus meridiei (strain ATCC BAA-275 / DSM 13257 / KCTC 12902 / NCIMB 13706 / S10) TaxID=768704 RepID=J7IU20_DESMD|nr:hypothetical protein [Desulfosporosinus meridiei]AFQ45220.1 hypothetical protein Desmer_3354 [Desulfosporosinus meridiei DSM 13257]